MELIFSSIVISGYEDSVNLHALVELNEGDVIDVFCSNTDIDIRADYNAAKFTGFLIKRKFK